MDQLIVVVVVGLLALGKWFFENSGRFQGNDEPDDAPQPPRPRSAPPRNLAHPMESDEEKMRRFMEALGLPPESTPPTPVRKPVEVPKPNMKHVGHSIAPSGRLPRKVAPQPIRPHIAPTLDTGGPLPEIPKTASVDVTAPASEVVSIPQMTFVEPEQLVASRRSQMGGRPASSSPGSKQRQTVGAAAAFRDQLRTPAALRNAILLREILGAPKGLQSTQTSSIFSPL